MIPAAVTKIFEEYRQSPEFDPANEIEVVAREGVALNQLIKLVLMSDALGRVQVMVPADCLLDVDALNAAIGRQLVALPHEDVNSLSQRYSLSELPAIPDITGFPAIIDVRLLAQETVYVESGQDGQLLKLSKEAFKLSIQKAKEARFAVPLSSIPSNEASPEQDLADIKQAIEKFTSLRIKQRLEDTLELPPLPQSAQEIIQLRADPDAATDQLADIIERDPSLSAQVVSWASSSFYNAPGKVKSVHDAIIRVLGFDMVMNLAMGLSLGRTLNLPQDEPKGYAPYWHHAMWMALGTTSMISKIEPTYRPGFGLSYLSGLLHNFGYLVLAHVFPPHFSLICRYIEANPHIDSSDIEHHLLGITREQVGSQLMSVWNMPAEVITALRHQKNPAYDGPNAEYAALLAVTQHWFVEKGVLAGKQIALDDSVYERLHLRPEDAEAAIDRLLENRDEVAAMANLMGR